MSNAGGLSAHQVVVDPVVEDQVVGPHPGERAAHVPAGDDQPLRRDVPWRTRSSRGDENAPIGAALAEVEQGDGEGHAVHALVALRGQVVEQGGGDDAAGAEARSRSRRRCR